MKQLENTATFSLRPRFTTNMNVYYNTVGGMFMSGLIMSASPKFSGHQNALSKKKYAELCPLLLKNLGLKGGHNHAYDDI